VTFCDTLYLYMEKSDEKKIWDIVIIGGGAAGMMAAIAVSEQSANVLIVEKNQNLGKKLLITGGGRCNVTNNQPDTRVLLEKYKSAGKYLFSAFSQWSVSDTLDFFHLHSMQTKVENELRVFPISDSAQSVWDVLVSEIKNHNVSVQSNSTVIKIEKEQEKITRIQLQNKTYIYAKSFILATGGISRPETGSTGDGYLWARQLGHTVRDPDVSLVPVSVSDNWIASLSGLSYDDIRISLWQNNIHQQSSRGKLLFTHIGVSGPVVLNASRDIGELFKYGDVEMRIDIFPTTDYHILDQQLQKLLIENAKKSIKNILTLLLPEKLAIVVLELCAIDISEPASDLKKSQRISIVQTLKSLKLHISGLLGTDKAVITNGGISLDEIDFKTMRSKLYDNLYIIGDLLDIDRPSGGYSLQLCWTTGSVAGAHAAKCI
jgi:predicted Rossmann fold flavoprotein